MFYRIKMNIVDVPLENGVVSNSVFPESTLPKLIFRRASRALWMLRKNHDCIDLKGSFRARYPEGLPQEATFSTRADERRFVSARVRKYVPPETRFRR